MLFEECSVLLLESGSPYSSVISSFSSSVTETSARDSFSVLTGSVSVVALGLLRETVTSSITSAMIAVTTSLEDLSKEVLLVISVI